MNPIVSLGFRQIFHTKKFWIVGIVTILPLLAGALLVIADVVSYQQDDRMSVPDLVPALGFIVLSGSVPLTALLLAGGMIADDIEDRTLTYLLVRPVKRAQLFFSKLLPVVIVAAALGALQALLFGLTRVASWIFVGSETVNVRPQQEAWAFFGETCNACEPQAVATGLVLFQGIAVGVLAAALLGAALSIVFSLVSLIAPRFHFLINLLIYLAWELPVGSTSGKGLGMLTFTFHAKSLLARWGGDDGWVVDDPAVPWFGIIWMGAWAVAWVLVAMRLASTKDFPVTSATS